MTEVSYKVLVDNEILARGMALSHALLFAKALFEEYYMDTDLRVSIEREDADYDRDIEEDNEKK